MADADFADPVRLDALGPEGAARRLSAPSQALPGIAARLGVPLVRALSGVVTITPERDGAHVAGAVRASLVRVCVVTLEDLDEEIDETFDVRYARGAATETDAELALEEDWAEPLVGDSLDAADLLVQQVALAMAPYPRKAGAAAPADLAPDPADISPFAVLRTLTSPKKDADS